jgi:nitrite reductase (NADH) large subunit
MNTLSEDELKMFVDSVRHYFKTTTAQEPQITSAFLGTGDVAGYEFNGIVTFSGSYNGQVIVSMPPPLLRELLLLQHETDLSDGNLLDAVGEIANTLGGNARRTLGPELEISVPVKLQGATGTRAARAPPPLRDHPPLEQPASGGVYRHGNGTQTQGGEHARTHTMKKLKLVMVGNGMAGVRTLEELHQGRARPVRHHRLRRRAAPQLQPHPAVARAGRRADAGRDRAQLLGVVQGQPHHTACRQEGGGGGPRPARRARRRRNRGDIRPPADVHGSNPFILPVPGKDLQGVIAYRDIADTNAMIEASQKYKKAVVIGGGLLGLEAANGLMLRGMDVTVVHVMPWLMERQLDDVAGKLLQKSLEDRGLKFLIGAQTQELVGNDSGRVKSIKFKDGTEVETDLVVMAVGIRPNTTLAESMRLHCNRGIVVNDTMQTVTDARIYSVGECAAHRGIAYGLVAPLFEQAKVAANHLAQFGIGRYTGSLTSTKLKVTGIDLFSAGEFMGAEGTEEIVMSDPAGGVYKKLVIKDDKLVGACLYGDTVDGSWYFKLLRDGRSVSDIRDKLMFGESNIGDTGHEGHSKAATMPTRPKSAVATA